MPESCFKTSLSLVLDGLRELLHKHCRDENDKSAKSAYSFARSGIQKRVEPVLVEQIQKRHVHNDKRHHHPVFVSGGGKHRGKLAVDDTDVGKLLNDGLQGVLQSSVILAQNERVDPLLKATPHEDEAVEKFTKK